MTRTVTFLGVDLGSPLLRRACIVATFKGNAEDEGELVAVTVDGVSVDPYTWQPLLSGGK